MSPPEPLTEIGAAQRFNRLCGHLLRRDWRRQIYRVWRGYWAEDTNQGVMRLAMGFVRQWQKDALDMADPKERMQTLAFALGLERRAKLENLLALASCMSPIAESGDRWDPDLLLLGTPAGVVDLEAGTLRPGQPDDRITMQTGVPFVPGAPAPRWRRFVREVCDDDDALAGFLQRAVGYSLTGITTEQCLFLLYGTGSNGKSVFVTVLAHVLGEYAWSMPFSTVEFQDRSSQSNDVASLAGRRFVPASETNDGKRLNEARVKALTGCEPITARFLYSPFFTFRPAAKFWLAVNHKPTVRDDSHGFWRRIRLVPFLRTFPVNLTLQVELEAEGEGILAWAIEGCLAWQREGLCSPAQVAEATEEYRADSDVLKAFLDEACEEAPGAEVRASDLYRHYQAWAEKEGFGERERLNVTVFGRKLAERFRKVHKKTGWLYQGIARKPGDGFLLRNDGFDTSP
jgi:putative DNA primase/helicase